MRAAVALALACILAACASGPRYKGPMLKAVAAPSKVVATELAFARMAQEKGQWTAFAAYATKDAIMFSPQAVNAQDWLKTQTDPAQAAQWQPHAVWSSCDGSLAVTRGAFQLPGGAQGGFITIWQRQDSGEYRWVMDQAAPLGTPLAAPEFVQAKTADCGTPEGAPLFAYNAQGQQYGGAAKDHSLHWDVLVQANGARSVKIAFWDGEAWATPVSQAIAAPE